MAYKTIAVVTIESPDDLDPKDIAREIDMSLDMYLGQIEELSGTTTIHVEAAGYHYEDKHAEPRQS